MLLISPAVMLSVFSALCHSEYQYLTQLIRPFILMEFTLSLPVFSLSKTELFASLVGGAERQTASNEIVVADRLCQYSLTLFAPTAYTMCSL